MAGAWVSSVMAKQSLVVVAVLVGVGVVALRARSLLLLGAALMLLSGALGSRCWAASFDGPPRAYSGPATLMVDPVTRGPLTRVVVRIDGRRFEVASAGSPGRRLAARSALQVVWLEGTMRPPTPRRRHRLTVRHIVGTFEVDHVIDWSTGSAIARSAERTRAALTRGASVMDAGDRALYLGLVLGDDRGESSATIDEFRRSGLGHLTAVSGQNVAFLIAVAAPLLRRWRTWWRWSATVLLLAWFCALTRFEPSVLRAATMAVLGATAFATGRQASPRRLLAASVIALVLVDPLLVWSLSYWLSVAATYGIVRLARPVAAGLPGPRWLRLPMAVALSAQVAVAPVAWLVFGREAVGALPANLLAEPVAAFVMTYGLPAGLAAAFLPRMVRSIVHTPTVLAVRWLAAVARLAARADVAMLRIPVTILGAGIVTVAAWRGTWRRRPEG